ncbi:MAG: LLM class flavin-dependent oxidoreductase [Gammaproteobacteria bacterium]
MLNGRRLDCVFRVHSRDRSRGPEEVRTGRSCVRCSEEEAPRSRAGRRTRDWQVPRRAGPRPAGRIAIAFTRSPFAAAMTALDLDRRGDGRLALGLGARIRSRVEGMFGMPGDQAAPQLREAAQAMRPFVAQARCCRRCRRRRVPRGEHHAAASRRQVRDCAAVPRSRRRLIEVMRVVPGRSIMLSGPMRRHTLQVRAHTSSRRNRPWNSKKSSAAAAPSAISIPTNPCHARRSR